MKRKAIITLASVVIVGIITLVFFFRLERQDLPTAPPLAFRQNLATGNATEPRDVTSPKVDMSALNVVELAERLAKGGRLNQMAGALAPHLSRNWRNSISFDEIAAVIQNPSSATPLRASLIDFLIHAADLSSDEKERLSQVLLAVAESSDTEVALRKYALLALRDKVGQDQAVQLRSLAEKPDTPAEVRGAAITALRRTGSEAHGAVVGAVLDNAATADAEVLRHAVVSAAKAGLASDRVETLRKIAMSTEDSELYASTIYALGLVGSREAVTTIMDAFGRLNGEHIARYSLQRNQQVILSMLPPDQPLQTLKAGIEAARRGGILAATEPLSLLRDRHPEPDIRNQARDAIADLAAGTEGNSNQPRR